MSIRTFSGSLPLSYDGDAEKEAELAMAAAAVEGVDQANFGDWSFQEVVGVEGELINFTVHVEADWADTSVEDEVIGQLESCDDVSGVEAD